MHILRPLDPAIVAMPVFKHRFIVRDAETRDRRISIIQSPMDPSQWPLGAEPKTYQQSNMHPTPMQYPPYGIVSASGMPMFHAGPMHGNPAAGYSLRSSAEQIRLNAADAIEDSLGSLRFTTAYVGNIADGVPDEFVDLLLSACGALNKWKRVQDASGKPKAFGFAEFENADGLCRCLRVLAGLPLYGKPLLVRTDENTKNYLQRYEEALKAQSKDTAADDGAALHSFRESDLAAVKSLCELLSDKKLTTPLQFLEKRLDEMLHGKKTTGTVLEEPAAGRSRSRERKPSEPTSRSRSRSRSKGAPRSGPKPNSSSRSAAHKGSLVAAQKNAYEERLRTWEARESHNARNRDQEKRREHEYVERESRARGEAKRFLESFDDVAGDGRNYEFYRNRENWRERRRRDRRREEDNDEREERRERGADKTPAEQEAADGEEALPTNPPELGQPMEETQQKPKLEFGFVGARGGESSESIGKRARSSAVDFFSTGTALAGTSSIPVKKRKALLPIQYTREELLEAGIAKDQVALKLAEQRKQMIQKIVERIPAEREPLFGWEVDWQYLNKERMCDWIGRKAAELSERNNKGFVEMVWRHLEKHGRPEELIEMLGEAMVQEHREIFVMRLWRFLAYETEAAAYNIPL